MTAQPPDLRPYRVVSVKQMAEALGYSVQHLRTLYRSGKIPRPHAIGGRKLGWPAAVLMALVSSLNTESDR